MTSTITEKAVDAPHEPERKNVKFGPQRIANAVLAFAIVVVAAIMIFGDLSKMLTGTLVIVLLVLLMLAKVPIAIAMILSSSLGLLLMAGLSSVESTVTSLMYNAVANWQLSVVPLFVFMGILMWKGGLTSKAYSAATNWLGRLPGGLAIATNFAGAGLAAGSGSTIGISYALGKMAIPEMMRAGYKPSLATGVVAMAGTLGQIIPPSVMLVIYAGIAQVPVGPQIISGIVPGILLALGFGVMIFVYALIKPSAAPRADLSGITWGTRFKSLLGLIPIVVVVVVVIGGIFAGFFTATEGAAFGVVAAFVLSWITSGKGNRGIKPTFQFLRDSVVETITSVASIFLLIIGVYVLTRVMSLSGVAQGLSDAIISLNLGRVELLFLLILVYLILGMFLDPLAMILLTVPLLQTPLEAVGVDMLWFGIFIVVLAEIAIVTPPVGMLAYIVHRLAQDPNVNLGRPIPLQSVFYGVLPFIGVALLMLIVFIFIPDLVAWLPNLSSAQ